jgi:hypothetical protein
VGQDGILQQVAKLSHMRCRFPLVRAKWLNLGVEEPT